MNTIDLTSLLPTDQNRFYFIGIGGIGMSGLAQFLAAKGYSVSGSDVVETNLTKRLQLQGINIQIAHEVSHLIDSRANIVIYTPAIALDNLQYVYAVNQPLILMRRSELLQLLTQYSISIAVIGTHGKTTTSSILSDIFMTAQMDPNIFVGGMLSSIQNNVRVGDGKWTIYEACEAYYAFKDYQPDSIVWTNLDWEHSDFFSSMENMKNYFKELIQKNIIQSIQKVLFFNADDPNIQSIIRSLRIDYLPQQCKERFISFGIDNHNVDFYAQSIRYKFNRLLFDVHYGNQSSFEVQSSLIGKHNIYNLLGAIVAAYYFKISKKKIIQATLQFKNTARRLETLYSDKQIHLIHDYAHHPTEIKSTLTALKDRYLNWKQLVIFQPHLYSRTRDFLSEFAKSLSSADEIYLLPIYSNREQEIDISSEHIQQQMQSIHQHQQTFCVSTMQLNHCLQHRISQIQNTNQSWIILALGAGDINLIASRFISLLQPR